MAIVRAESLWEIPVLGKLLAAGAEKRTQAAHRETEEFLASLGQWDEDAAAPMTRTSVATAARSAGREPTVAGDRPADPSRPSGPLTPYGWPRSGPWVGEPDGVGKGYDTPPGHGPCHLAQAGGQLAGLVAVERPDGAPASRSVVRSIRPELGAGPAQPVPVEQAPPLQPVPRLAPLLRRPPTVGPEEIGGRALGGGEGHQCLTAVQAPGHQGGDMSVSPVFAQRGASLPQRPDGVAAGDRAAVGTEQGATGSIGGGDDAIDEGDERWCDPVHGRDDPAQRGGRALRRARRTDGGPAKSQASGSDRSTMDGWKLKKVAETTAGPTGPRGAARPAK